MRFFMHRKTHPRYDEVVELLRRLRFARSAKQHAFMKRIVGDIWDEWINRGDDDPVCCRTNDLCFACLVCKYVVQLVQPPTRLSAHRPCYNLLSLWNEYVRPPWQNWWAASALCLAGWTPAIHVPHEWEYNRTHACLVLRCTWRWAEHTRPGVLAQEHCS